MLNVNKQSERKTSGKAIASFVSFIISILFSLLTNYMVSLLDQLLSIWHLLPKKDIAQEENNLSFGGDCLTGAGLGFGIIGFHYIFTYSIWSYFRSRLGTIKADLQRGE